MVTTDPGTRISTGVQAADFDGDGRDVDRLGRVHGDQRTDADRPVVLAPRGQRQRHLVGLVPDPGVVAGLGELGGARAVHLDQAGAQAAQLV